jgi:hypothetical protein
MQRFNHRSLPLFPRLEARDHLAEQSGIPIWIARFSAIFLHPSPLLFRLPITILFLLLELRSTPLFPAQGERSRHSTLPHSHFLMV